MGRKEGRAGGEGQMNPHELEGRRVELTLVRSFVDSEA